jgi:hypothetical protein
MASDRAHVVATSIVAILADALRAWLRDDVSCRDVRAHIEALLRDEFDDIARMVRDDIRLRDE